MKKYLMPNFKNKDLDSFGFEKESEEETIFRVTLKLLTEKGYEGFTLDEVKKVVTTARNGEAIEKYENKEDLVRAAVVNASEVIAKAYDQITNPAKNYIMGPGLNRDEGLRELERLLTRHIHLCFHPKNRSYVILMANEYLLPEEMRNILPIVGYEHFTAVLSQLILKVSQIKKQQIACLAACNVCGLINSYILQPETCSMIYEGMTGREPKYAEIQDFINDFLLRSIEVNTSMNKMF